MTYLILNSPSSQSSVPFSYMRITTFDSVREENKTEHFLDASTLFDINMA